MSELKELLNSVLYELNSLIKFKNGILKKNLGPYSEDEPDWHDGETCHLLQLAIRDLDSEWTKNVSPKLNGWYLVKQGDHKWVREYKDGEWLNIKAEKYGLIYEWHVLP